MLVQMKVCCANVDKFQKYLQKVMDSIANLTTGTTRLTYITDCTVSNHAMLHPLPAIQVAPVFQEVIPPNSPEKTVHRIMMTRSAFSLIHINYEMSCWIDCALFTFTCCQYFTNRENRRVVSGRKEGSLDCKEVSVIISDLSA